MFRRFIDVVVLVGDGVVICFEVEVEDYFFVVGCDFIVMYNIEMLLYFILWLLE